MWSLLVFALIGLLAGAAARLLYPGREPLRILGTMVLGMVGALVGGIISLSSWPVEEDQFQSANLLMSLVGAMILITFWTGVAYVRSLGTRSTS